MGNAQLLKTVTVPEGAWVTDGAHGDEFHVHIYATAPMLLPENPPLQ